MPAHMTLKYEGDEGISVIVYSQNDQNGFILHNLIIKRNGRTIAHARTEDLLGAQTVARLLVGIEIQPDGAAWRRGPRPPALPTDKDGKIIAEQYDYDSDCDERNTPRGAWRDEDDHD